MVKREELPVTKGIEMVASPKQLQTVLTHTNRPKSNEPRGEEWILFKLLRPENFSVPHIMLLSARNLCKANVFA